MSDKKFDYRVFDNHDMLSSLKSLALAHCAGRSQSEFSDGFLNGLASVATLVGVNEQFKTEAIIIRCRQLKLIEVK